MAVLVFLDIFIFFKKDILTCENSDLVYLLCFRV